MELHSTTAHELAPLLQKRKISSTELTKAVLERIEKVEPRVNAYVTLTPELAMRMAQDADQRLQQGNTVTPLTGIPLAIKDNMCTRGILTSCASRILHNFVPPYDATVVTKLRNAGAVFVGKTNLDEFAMGSSTENSAMKLTLNPWDFERIPGGSSGGSAAAVAAGETILALGSDTGGSIRQPAALCGVVGLKPTYGRVSRYGLVAFASSLDQIGTLVKDVEDTALLMNCIAAHDPMDSTSGNIPVPDYTTFLNHSINGIKVGVPKEYFVEGMDPVVEQAVRKAIDTLAELGAEIIEISLPHTEYAIATYYLCATAEASSNLARYDGAHYGYRSPGTDNIVDMFSKTRAEGFGKEVKRRIMLGTYALSAGYYDAYYLKALKVRTLIKQDFEQAFQQCDVIVTPTTPTPAFRVGEKTEDPLQMYLSDIFTISVNLAGIPAVSLPCGFAGSLPVGIQIMAGSFEEGKILRVAHCYEQAAGFCRSRPTL